jgi:hypothetical protein
MKCTVLTTKVLFIVIVHYFKLYNRPIGTSRTGSGLECFSGYTSQPSRPHLYSGSIFEHRHRHRSAQQGRQQAEWVHPDL